MRIFFRFGSTQILELCHLHHVRQNRFRLLWQERHRYRDGGVVRGHGGEVQAFGALLTWGDFQLRIGKGACELTAAVGAVIEEEAGIVVAD